VGRLQGEGGSRGRSRKSAGQSRGQALLLQADIPGYGSAAEGDQPVQTIVSIVQLHSAGGKLIWPKDVLTRFEVARLVGARALQIALGAPMLVDEKKHEGMPPAEVAKSEFKNKIVPITVKRRLPDSSEVVISAKTAIENWLKDHNGEI